mmetsp:Transcript_25445/g.83716  ORF Transcript_25445/g.83716 Transcript_25445/m.83716 type:complete len:268 (+) Transcript_25445:2497-3300(+)
MVPRARELRELVPRGRLDVAAHLMRNPGAHEALLLELELGDGARLGARDSHAPHVVDVQLPDDEVVDRGGHFGPRKLLAVVEREVQLAERVELDAAAPKLALDIRRTPVPPRPPFAVAGDDGWVVAHLLRNVAQTLLRAHILKRLELERVERLERAALSRGVAAHRKGSDVRVAEQAPGRQRSRDVEQLAVLEILAALLQRRDWLVEKDWQAHLCQIFADALLDDAPQTHLLHLLDRIRKESSTYRHWHVVKATGSWWPFRRLARFR